MNTSDFAILFDNLCEQSGKNNVQIAKDLEVDKATIGRWRSGERTPKLSKLSKIASYFNVDINIFSLSNGDKTKSPTSKKRKYSNELLDLIKNNDEAVDIISILCKSTRISKNLPEKITAENANLDLNDYLAFEEDGHSIAYSDIFSILDALDLDYGYVLGYISFALESNLYKFIKDIQLRKIIERIIALDKDQLKLLKTRLENLNKE